MAVTPDQLEEALMQFRLDVIEALTSLEVEVNMLRDLLTTKELATKSELERLREKSRKLTHRFRDRLTEKISLAHEPRTVPESTR